MSGLQVTAKGLGYTACWVFAFPGPAARPGPGGLAIRTLIRSCLLESAAACVAPQQSARSWTLAVSIGCSVAGASVVVFGPVSSVKRSRILGTSANFCKTPVGQLFQLLSPSLFLIHAALWLTDVVALTAFKNILLGYFTVFAQTRRIVFNT